MRANFPIAIQVIWFRPAVPNQVTAEAIISTPECSVSFCHTGASAVRPPREVILWCVSGQRGVSVCG